MDLQLFLALNVIALSALVALQSLISRPPGVAGWLAVNLLVIAIAGAALELAADWAGAISLGAFVPLVLAPAVLSQMAQRRVNMSRYGEAAFLQRLAALLHPSAGSRFAAALSSALAASEAGDDITPLTDLMRASKPEHRSIVEALIARSQGRWADALAIVRASPNARELASIEIRALGETGQTDEMIAVFTRAKPTLQGYHLLYGQLFVLAFAGRSAAVERLLAAQLRSIDDETKTYWRAIAALNTAATRDEGRAMLTRLAASSRRATTRHAAEHHLAVSALSPLPVLSPAAKSEVDATELQVVRAASMTGLRVRHAPATLLLMAINGLAFGLEEAWGGSENLEALVRLGALWPPLVLDAGEWWRLVTPSFLHFGWLHLGANMLMLVVLGRLVESLMGWRWLLAGYVVGGVVSTAAVLGMMVVELIPFGVLIGASGSIFALFGMIVARTLVDWRQSRDVLDRRRLVSLGLVMLVQFAIDVSVPQISMSAHMAGLLIGLVLGSAASRRSAGAGMA